MIDLPASLTFGLPVDYELTWEEAARDKDVVCYVIRGKGRLRTDGGIRPLESGMLCHVPAKTPHDFAALDEEMLLLYILIDQPPA